MNVDWTALDEVSTVKKRRDVLDQIGVAFHDFDVTPSPAALAKIRTLIAAYDKKAW